MRRRRSSAEPAPGTVAGVKRAHEKLVGRGDGEVALPGELGAAALKCIGTAPCWSDAPTSAKPSSVASSHATHSAWASVPPAAAQWRTEACAWSRQYLVLFVAHVSGRVYG